MVARPELKGRVMILHGRDLKHGPDNRRPGNYGQYVLACSRAAYHCGVRPHMPLAEATTLCDHAVAEVARAAQGDHAPNVKQTPADRLHTGQRHADRAKPVIASSPSQLHHADTHHADAPKHAHPVYISEHDAQADAAALRDLAQWCECFSPLVGFEHLESACSTSSASVLSSRDTASQRLRPDCLYLEVTHLAPYFGSEQDLARLVAESFSRRGYCVRVAIAYTLGAAWAFAHFASRNATHIDLRDTLPASFVPALTRAATAVQPPGTTHVSSFLVVPPAATSAALHSLPIEALRLPDSILALLRQLGIDRIAQLACLPRASLLARFGDLLLKRWDQASGVVDELFIAHHHDPQFQTGWVLEHPTTKHCVIQSILGTLIERLTDALRQRGEGVMQCVCHLTCTSAVTPAPQLPPSPALTLRVGLFQPTAIAEHLLQLFQMQLERLLLSSPVERMVLEATFTAPLQRRQRELFSDSRRHTPQQLARLVDRLSSRLGPANVVQAHIQSDAQPEFAYRYHSLTNSGRRPPRATHRTARSRRTTVRPNASPRALAKQSASPHPFPRSSATIRSDAARSATIRSDAARRRIRPLHLRSPPLPLEVIALAVDGPPCQILFGKQAYRVARCWGPERIETGWWRGHSVRRDYYRIETNTGHWLWVFRQLADNRWFLHGMFG